MARGGRSESLALIGWQVETAAIRFALLTAGVTGHHHVDLARNRLRGARDAITRAGGGLSAWTRTWIGVGVLGAACWVAAAIARDLIGLPDGWTITISVVTVLGLMWPTTLANNALAAWADRRRTTRAPRPLAVPAEVSPPAEILGLLRLARDGLTAAMRQEATASRFRYLATTPAGFDWLRQRHRRLAWMSAADRQLAQAWSALELWQSTGSSPP